MDTNNNPHPPHDHHDHEGMCTMCEGRPDCAGRHGHRRMLHWLLKIIVLSIIFSLGVKFGELKGMLEARGYSGHYYGTMMYGNDGNGYYGGPMMGIRAQDGTVTPATPTAPTTPKQ